MLEKIKLGLSYIVAFIELSAAAKAVNTVESVDELDDRVLRASGFRK